MLSDKALATYTRMLTQRHAHCTHVHVHEIILYTIGWQHKGPVPSKIDLVSFVAFLTAKYHGSATHTYAHIYTEHFPKTTPDTAAYWPDTLPHLLLMERVVSRHIDGCAKCNTNRLSLPHCYIYIYK